MTNTALLGVGGTIGAVPILDSYSTNTDMKEILDIIDRNMPSIIDIVKDIGEHPELGYKEFRTSGIVNDFLRQSEYTTETNLAITGIKTKLKEKSEGPNIALIGELDGIPCPESSKADKITGATHNCGHNLQLGVMMAVAQAFKQSGISSVLGGNVSFIAAPAEEYIELDFRSELKRTGKISYFGGKQEMVKCGVFDDINAAMMIHSVSNVALPVAVIVRGGNGFTAEKIKYIGKTAHAAASPEEGINALHAAVLGINNVNAMREVFKDGDHSRVHYIITKGGDAVNSVPADVRMECFVRSYTVQSIKNLLEKTNRAFTAGGDAIGAKTEIEILPGYMPLACNEQINKVFAENAEKFMTKMQIVPLENFNGSTDMGDISQLMPAIHPLSGGVKGSLHAADFEVVDYKAAITIPAKIAALTIIDLLKDDATKMKQILKGYKPLMTKEKYLELLK